MDTSDYRDYLRQEYLRRRATVPGYSLRAYARDLGLSPSHLCEILNGGQNLSPARARLIAARLSLSPAAERRFSALVDVAGRKAALVRAEAERELHGAVRGAAERSGEGFESLLLAFDRRRQAEAFQRLAEVFAALNAEFSVDERETSHLVRLRLVPASR
jgi:transcriptional regulator with XRE-family HTH domain